MSIYLVIIIFCISACCDHLSGYKDNYKEALEELDINCSSGISDVYLKCSLDDEELCYYAGADNIVFKFGYSTLFSTPGPSFGTDDTVTIVGRRGSIKFYDPDNPNLNGLEIRLPIGPFEQSEIEYLEKLFSKKELNYNMSSDSNSVIVEYLLKKPTNGAGANIYDNSSIHGIQEDGYFRIEDVDRMEDETTITYQFEFQFECLLYYNTQYKKDVWRALKNGVLRGEIIVDK